MGNIYNRLEIVDRVKAVVVMRGTTVRKMLLDCGFGQNTLENMKTSMPSAAKLATIADGLECSVDYLLGRTTEVLTSGSDQPPVPPSFFFGGEGSPPVHISGKVEKMLGLYIRLSEEEQDRLIGRAEVLLEQQEERRDEALSQEVKGNSSGSSPAKAV